MTFNSIEYFLFLPPVLFLYWNLPEKARVPFVVAASYLFYGWWDWRFLGLIILSTVVDFTLARWMNTFDDDKIRKRLLWVSVGVNLGILGIFKYAGFFTESFVSAMSSLGFNTDSVFIDIALPVGISFYTFQTISYTFDVFRRRLEPERNIVVFAAYVAYFPQLVAGPIERATNLLPQFQRRPQRPDQDKVNSAVMLFLLGLFKKVVIADQVGNISNLIYEDPAGTSAPTLALGLVAFVVQIYFDFSGYTDMARGTSRLLGIELMENFTQPLVSRSLTEVWNRWHLSLSLWLRDYLFIPLGGTRSGLVRGLANLMIVMLATGLWHGADWHFVVWGGFMGLVLVLERLFLPTIKESAPLAWSQLPRIVLGTGWFVISAPLFRCETLTDAWDYYVGIFTLRGGFSLDRDQVFILLAACVVVWTHEVLMRRYKTKLATAVSAPARSPVLTGVAIGTVLVTVILASGQSAPQFVYFQF